MESRFGFPGGAEMARSSPGLLAACDDPRLIGLGLWPVQRRLLSDVERQRSACVAAGSAERQIDGGGGGARLGCGAASAASTRWFCRGRRVIRCVSRRRAGRRGLSCAAALAILEGSELLSPLVASVSEDSIVLRSGNVISAFPVGSRSARGWPISCVVFDEMAHHVDSEGNAAAEQMWRALTPSVLQFGAEGRIICASTPSGSGGFFAQLYGQVESGEIEGAAHHFSTAESNPTVDAAVPERASGRRSGEEAYGRSTAASSSPVAAAFSTATRSARWLRGRVRCRRTAAGGSARSTRRSRRR